jgi:glycosyltransferase involved in cell wall biosynthesis
MNILILHSSSDLYGGSKILLVTVKILTARGHNISVVLSEYGPLADELQNAGIEIIYIKLGILRRKYKSLPGIINRMTTMRRAYTSVKKLIREKHIDILFTNTTSVLVGAYAARKTRTKHIWHVHEIIEQPAWLYKFIGKTLNKYSDTVIAVSDAVKQSWSRFVDEQKIVTIHNGIDYTPYLEAKDGLRKELGIDNETVVIGMIGRVHHWKGQGYFIRIAARLLKQFPHWRFVMIGDAFPGNEYLYAEMEKVRQEENPGDGLINLGYRTDIPALLQGFDILVLPSILPDPFPTVILEAMASGKPVAATEHGGAPEMVDEGVTGTLIPVNDVAIAVDRIRNLAVDKQKRIQMGEAGKQKVLSEYSLPAFGQKIINVFK